MTQLKCETLDCTGFYEIHKYTRNLGRALKLCKPCKKEHARLYQQNYNKALRVGQTPKKRGGYRPRKHVDVLQNPAESGRKESERAKWGRKYKCKQCGRNPWPNYNLCKPCHTIVSKHRSGMDEHAMPNVPMTR